MKFSMSSRLARLVNISYMLKCVQSTKWSAHPSRQIVTMETSHGYKRNSHGDNYDDDKILSGDHPRQFGTTVQRFGNDIIS
jgi:hypothetical protein